MAGETVSPQAATDVIPPAETNQQHVETPPSATGPPTTSFRKVSTSQGDSIEVHADQIKKPSEVNRDDPNINVVELAPSRSLTFKEHVYGYAKVIRGTAFGQPDVKEEGEQVLRGEHGIPPRRGSQSSK